jgi:hypothetical protein
MPVAIHASIFCSCARGAVKALCAVLAVCSRDRDVQIGVGACLLAVCGSELLPAQRVAVAVSGNGIPGSSSSSRDLSAPVCMLQDVGHWGSLAKVATCCALFVIYCSIVCICLHRSCSFSPWITRQYDSFAVCA